MLLECGNSKVRNLKKKKKKKKKKNVARNKEREFYTQKRKELQQKEKQVGENKKGNLNLMYLRFVRIRMKSFSRCLALHN